VLAILRKVLGAVAVSHGTPTRPRIPQSGRGNIERRAERVANITRLSRVMLWEDNGHRHGGTTTLKNELRVHLIQVRVRQLICKCAKYIYVP
jgi:hypothetical protein